jgi:8-oxo-dGTP pyrophosphatase MutT (NUDIX family)
MNLKIKLFKQTPGFCGPSSVRMVLDYYGLRKTESQFAKLIGATRKDGCDQKQIILAIKKLGFGAYYKNKSSIKELRKLLFKKIPIIVSWSPSGDYGHYSVIVGIEKNNILIADPKKDEIQSMVIKEFDKKWYEFYDNKKEMREIIVIMPKSKGLFRKAVFIVVYRVNHLNKDISYLLLKRKKHWTGWEFPKGGVEKGESLIKTAKREGFEESGLRVFNIKKYHISGKYKYKKLLEDRPGFIGQTFSLFSGEVLGDKRVRFDKKEHSGFKWLPFHTAFKKLTHKNQKFCLKLVNKRIK